MATAPGFPFDPERISHVSPIEWKTRRWPEPRRGLGASGNESDPRFCRIDAQPNATMVQTFSALRSPRMSERTGNAGNHALVAVVVDRNVGAIRFDGIADIGSEAAVPQGPVQHPHSEPKISVELPGSK